MKKKKDVKVKIRDRILKASEKWKSNFSGKVFLYVYDDQFFEVLFKTSCFMHLVGVESNLGALDFYNKATRRQLSTGQFSFSNERPYITAKKKIDCLLKLNDITNQLVYVIKELKTNTFTYKIGISNLEFTIGLTENIDKNGKKVNDYFLPRTLRVKDNAIKRCKDSRIIDFIFEKDITEKKYSKITYRNPNKDFPEIILKMIEEDLHKKVTD